MFETKIKFALKTNSKLPCVKWSNPKNQKKEINTNIFNVGLITGPINDIIVVDVDAKNNGIEEMEKYYAEFGEPQTIKQTTPNGGYHLIFKYTTSNDDDQFLIDNYLKTKTSFRNVGIDIRSKGGYIVLAPSKIDDKCYQMVEGRTELLELPHSLIEFLLDGHKMNKKVEEIKHSYNSNFIYDISDNELIEMLKRLDESHYNNTNRWIKITNILYGLNKFVIWNDWSTMSRKYDYDKNMEIWNNIIPSYDINYLRHILKMEPINRFKKYNMLSSQIPTKQMNSKYIQLTKEDLVNSNTVIMKSCTGTGKTTTTAQAIKQYNLNLKKPKRILSIISKKSLAAQHIKSFADADINLINYLDKNKTLSHDNIVCCINSIMLFRDVHEYEFSNYIVYIDEIASFLNDITHNETLRGKLKLCYQILMRIVRNCHKLILSDAKINDNVFNFIRTREQRKPKTTYIENLYQKYANISAVRVRDEQLQLDMMIEHVKTDNYFLCASDSCKTITKLYMECLKYNTIDKFIIITAYNQIEISNASEQFKNKFVFYSPSIIFGIDFSIDTAQDVFIYNKGRTLDPSAIFQQTTRTRNINTLYYYSELKNADPFYEKVDDCKQLYSNIHQTSKEINEVCVYMNENDMETIVENTFFDIFTYNEYVADIYQTNKTAHYENILKTNGFVLSQIGNVKKMSKVMNDELNQPLEEIKEQAFNDLIETGHTEDFLLSSNIHMLKLENKDSEIIEKYKEIICDKFKLEEHLNIIRSLKDEEFIQQKIFDLERDNYNITVMSSTYHKIKHIQYLESRMKIKRYQVDVKLDDITFFDISENEYALICKVFRIIRKKPSNNDDLFKLYVSMLRNIMTSDIVVSKKGTTRKSQKITYTLNKDLIKFHIQLNMYANPYLRNFEDDLLTYVGVEKPIPPKIIQKDDLFIDEDAETIYKKSIAYYLDFGINDD